MTGRDNHAVLRTVLDQTQYRLDVDSGGDGAFDDLAVTVGW